MYQALASQLEIGLTPQHAFESLGRLLTKVSPELGKVAKKAAAASAEGRLIADGLAETGCIPLSELGVLKIAERNNSLHSACQKLQQRTVEKLSLTRAVLMPNFYYSFIAICLLFFVWQTKDILRMAPSKVQLNDIPVYQISMFLHSWLLPATILAGVFLVISLHGRRHWFGAIRKSLILFAAEYHTGLSIRIADLAAFLYDEGATHTDFLLAVEESFGAENYVRRAVNVARQRYIGDGETIEDAMAEVLLSPQMAALLASMAPGGQHSMYAPAYRTLGQLLRIEQQSRYAALAATFQAVLLISIGFLIIISAHGIYSAVLPTQF